MKIEKLSKLEKYQLKWVWGGGSWKICLENLHKALEVIDDYEDIIFIKEWIYLVEMEIKEVKHI